MFDIKYSIQKAAVIQIISYLRKDPEKNIGKVFQIIRGLDSNDNFSDILVELEKNITDTNSTLNKFVVKLSTAVDENIFQTFLLNLIMNSCIKGSSIIKKNTSKSVDKIKPVIILEPYSKNKTLIPTLEMLNKKIEFGKSTGVYSYIFAGDEPLLSKDMILTLCKINSDCIFTVVTSGINCIDKPFCADICKLGNIIPIIKFKNEDKTINLTSQYWQNVVKTMKLLQSYKILFGFYTVFTAYNADFILSTNFIDCMINSGAYFSLYASKFPKNLCCDSTLDPTMEQKENLKNTIIAWRKEKIIFNIDMENDSRLAGVNLDFLDI